MIEFRFMMARLLTVAGCLFIAISIVTTLSHIGSPAYQVHSWYHFFREGIGQAIKVGLILWIMFGARKMRTRTTWKILMVVIIAIILPYCIGLPFHKSLTAPSLADYFNQIMQAICLFGAMYLAKGEFDYTRVPNFGYGPIDSDEL